MRHLITAVFLVLAIFLGIAGSAGGAIALVAAGIICELIFWVRILRKPKVKSVEN